MSMMVVDNAIVTDSPGEFHHRAPALKTCGGDEVEDALSLRDGELPARSAAIPATAGIQSR